MLSSHTNYNTWREESLRSLNISPHFHITQRPTRLAPIDLSVSVVMKVVSRYTAEVCVWNTSNFASSIDRKWYVVDVGLHYNFDAQIQNPSWLKGVPIYKVSEDL